MPSIGSSPAGATWPFNAAKAGGFNHPASALASFVGICLRYSSRAGLYTGWCICSAVGTSPSAAARPGSTANRLLSDDAGNMGVALITFCLSAFDPASVSIRSSTPLAKRLTIGSSGSLFFTFVAIACLKSAWYSAFCFVPDIKSGSPWPSSN